MELPESPKLICAGARLRVKWSGVTPSLHNFSRWTGNPRESFPDFIRALRPPETIVELGPQVHCGGDTTYLQLYRTLNKQPLLQNQVQLRTAQQDDKYHNAYFLKFVFISLSAQFAECQHTLGRVFHL